MGGEPSTLGVWRAWNPDFTVAVERFRISTGGHRHETQQAPFGGPASATAAGDDQARAALAGVPRPAGAAEPRGPGQGPQRVRVAARAGAAAALAARRPPGAARQVELTTRWGRMHGFPHRAGTIPGAYERAAGPPAMDFACAPRSP